MATLGRSGQINCKLLSVMRPAAWYQGSQYTEQKYKGNKAHQRSSSIEIILQNFKVRKIIIPNSALFKINEIILTNNLQIDIVGLLYIGVSDWHSLVLVIGHINLHFSYIYRYMCNL